MIKTCYDEIKTCLPISLSYIASYDFIYRIYMSLSDKAITLFIYYAYVL